MIAAVYARIVMLTVLGLLALATSASAECAWAMWLNPANSSTGWSLLKYSPWFTSKADCENTATFRYRGTSSQPGDVLCLPQGVEPTGARETIEFRPWRGRAMMTDTVAPRGPKGGTR